MPRRVDVYGPAYLDRVIRVDGPLHRPPGRPIDGSVDGAWIDEGGRTPGRKPWSDRSLRVYDPDPGPRGPRLTVRTTRLPGAGSWGEIALSRSWADLSRSPADPPGGPIVVDAVEARDDLGGMGAGYAKAFGGMLFSALGGVGPSDPRGIRIAELLGKAAIDHRPLRVPGRESDWTLLITSGPYGDKLPIGFRGCHAALTTLDAGPCDLRVAAALPNRLAEMALRAPGAGVRFFAPAMRNADDREPPVSAFADAVDILACNRPEWEAIGGRDAILGRVPVVAVTDGPAGAAVYYRTDDGATATARVPAFPRDRPPRDTNRAGEAFASTLVRSLLDSGWSPGPLDAATARRAAQRASAAAALVLDRPDFGFPDDREVDEALRAGRVV